MIQIDFGQYLDAAYTPLYQLSKAKQIVKDYNIDTQFDEIEFVIPKTVLTISKSFFQALLQERVYNDPFINSIRKSIKISTITPEIRDNFESVMKQLLKERKQIDNNLSKKELKS